MFGVKRNHCSGRVHLSSDTFARFSLLPNEQYSVVIEDLKKPQVHTAESHYVCGRIDLAPHETSQLLHQWLEIVTAHREFLTPPSLYESEGSDIATCGQVT